MSRRRKPEIRTILPDPKFKSELLAKFINKIMERGKKSRAEEIVYGALATISEKKKTDAPLTVLEAALENVRPTVEVKSRRVGGATYQVPVDVRPDRALALGMRWLIHSARERSDGRTMQEKLAAEILDASSNKGAAVKKREDTHKMAEANKAFAHYRW